MTASTRKNATDQERNVPPKPLTPMFVYLVGKFETMFGPKTITRSATKRPVSHRTSGRSRSTRSCRCGTDPPSSQCRCQLERDHPVDRDRDQNQRARNRLRPKRRDTYDVERGENRVQEQRS